MDEAERRRQAIAAGRTDLGRWGDPAQLEPAWAARARLAADFVPAGARVLDIGCGTMELERHLPSGCAYVPCDVVARDARTLVVDLNETGIPEHEVAEADLVVMLGVWEYLYRPGDLFAALARTGRPILCSYCVTELTSQLDRRALGWVNDLSLEALTGLARAAGYRVAAQTQVDAVQMLFKLVHAPEGAARARRRVHVISYNNVGNFGDRLGFHMLNEVLPPHAEVSWGTLRPFTPVPEGIDLLVVGIGNSLFGELLDDQLLEAVRRAPAAVGIFGTQYRELLPAGRLGALLDRLTHWFARFEEDLLLYGRGRSNTSHLGDWLINAFPLAAATDDRTLTIGRGIWDDLPLDRTIQQIQRHRTVVSERLHPLLCALTSAERVAYREQRESGDVAVGSGKFRSMLLDVFGRTYPEAAFWPVDRERVAGYKALVRHRSEELRARLAGLLA